MSRNNRLRTLSFHTVPVVHRGSALEVSCFLRKGIRETVVYLHGLGSTKYDFWGAVDAASLDDYTLFAFDFPGSGNTSYPDALTLDMDDLVEITADVLAACAITNATFIGHSMGGLIAVRLAEKHPALVHRLINVEGNLAPEDCGVFSRRTAQHTWETFIADNGMATLQAKFATAPYLGARLFADTFRRAVSPRAFYDYCVSIVDLSDSGALLPAFGNLRIPRLFIYGSANEHLSYLPRLPDYGIQVIEVPDSDHWPYHDNPDVYYQTLGDFIAQP